MIVEGVCQLFTNVFRTLNTIWTLSLWLSINAIHNQQRLVTYNRKYPTSFHFNTDNIRMFKVLCTNFKMLFLNIQTFFNLSPKISL